MKTKTSESLLIKYIKNTKFFVIESYLMMESHSITKSLVLLINFIDNNSLVLVFLMIQMFLLIRYFLRILNFVFNVWLFNVLVFLKPSAKSNITTLLCSDNDELN